MYQETKQTDQMFCAAYWVAAFLTAIGIPLALLWTMVVLSNDGIVALFFSNAIKPNALVAVCVIHWDVLARAYKQKVPQHRLPWLSLVALSGVITCLSMIHSYITLPHGPSGIMFILGAMGILCSSQVCRIWLQEWAQRRRA